MADAPFVLNPNVGAATADATNAAQRNQQFSALITAFNGLAEAIQASLIGGQTGNSDGVILVSKGTGGRALQPSGVTIASLNSIAQFRILARNDPGTGPAEALTLSEVLDFVGSPANGDLLMRSGGAWTRLGIGSTSQVLTVSGGLPAWGAGGAPAAAQGRVTLSTSTPVMTSTVSGATTVFYTPYLGKHVPIFDGSNFAMTDTGGELSQATTDATKSPAAVTTNSTYDIFVWSDSGTIRATRGPAWSSDTSRGTGAGTSELVRVNGILLNAVNITNGPSSQRGTYVGSVRSNGSSQIDWTYGAVSSGGTAGVLGVWNNFNRVEIASLTGDSTDSWTYSSSTWRAANASNTMRCSFLQGLAEDFAEGSYTAQVLSFATGGTGGGILGTGTAVAYDSTSSPSGRRNVTAASGTTSHHNTHYVAGLGWHFVQAIERATGGVSNGTFFGDTAGHAGLVLRGRF